MNFKDHLVHVFNFWAKQNGTVSFKPCQILWMPISSFMMRPKKILWFPLHAPEKVGTEGMSFYLLNIFICKFGDLLLRRRRTKFLTTFFIRSRLLALYINSQPPPVGGATAKTIKNFRHGFSSRHGRVTGTTTFFSA
jgi:hypothetical protein